MSILERIYFFHANIKAGKYPNTTALTHTFEISSATAHRDVSYLRDRLLAPLAFHHRNNGYYYTREDFQLPFENSPSMTLILGLLGNMAKETGLAELPELAEIKERLQMILFPGQRNIDDFLYCEWVEKELINSSVFQVVLEALRKQQQLKFSYRDGTGKISRRRVDPMKLVNYQGRWYLLSWCWSRKARRMFHLARVKDAQLQEAPITHQIEQEDTWLNKSFGIFKGPVTYKATIRFTGLAAELIRHQHWHPEQQCIADDNGVTLSLPIADDRELLMKVLKFGSQAEIIAPKVLRHKLQKELKQTISLYR